MGGTVTVAGVEIRLEASGSLAVEDGVLSFMPASIQAVGAPR